jgi:hypothetical protein
MVEIKTHGAVIDGKSGGGSRKVFEEKAHKFSLYFNTQFTVIISV